MTGKHVLRLLGLSVLVAIGVMGVSTSAAQAGWVLLLNKQEVIEIKLNVTAPEGELLVPELGLAIHCDGGTGEMVASSLLGRALLASSATITFTKCTDLNFGEVCSVSSKDQSAGTIVAGGSGKGFMGSENEEYAIEASSSEFTNIVYTGTECPLTEIDGRVSGEIVLDILNSTADTNSKQVRLLDVSLNYGNEDALLHDSNGKDLEVSVSVTGKNTWALHLSCPSLC